MSNDPSIDDVADYAAEHVAGLRGSHRALLGRFRQQKIEVRQFAGPRAHVGEVELRIAHLTDMHFGRVTPEKVQREAVRLTNEREPDLVVLTGDFVCHGQGYLDQLASVLGELEAPAVGVLGNHDYWSGEAEVCTALTRAGVEILKNRHTTLTLNRHRLQVVGLDDAYTGHADREAAVKGLRADLPTLGLSHIAEEADFLWSHGVPLVLAGHTHAGQVTLARLHELSMGKVAGHKYVHGLYGARRPVVDRAQGPKGAVYVGAGIGAAVLPFRIGERAKREVTMFELGLGIGEIDEHHTEQRALKGRKPTREQTDRRNAMVHKKAARRLRAMNGKRKK